MKLQTKFEIGEEVLTKISERRGRVTEIHVAKRFFDGWRLNETSLPEVRYYVEIYFPHRDTRSDSLMYGLFREQELEKVS